MITLNVGGGVVPLAFATYLLLHNPLKLSHVFIATAIVTGVANIARHPLLRLGTFQPASCGSHHGSADCSAPGPRTTCSPRLRQRDGGHLGRRRPLVPGRNPENGSASRNNWRCGQLRWDLSHWTSGGVVGVVPMGGKSLASNISDDVGPK